MNLSTNASLNQLVSNYTLRSIRSLINLTFIAWKKNRFIEQQHFFVDIIKG